MVVSELLLGNSFRSLSPILEVLESKSGDSPRESSNHELLIFKGRNSICAITVGNGSNDKRDTNTVLLIWFSLCRFQS